MKAQLHADYKLHPLVHSKLYVIAIGRELPNDFLIISHHGGTATGIKGVRDHAEGEKLVEILNKIW